MDKRTGAPPTKMTPDIATRLTTGLTHALLEILAFHDVSVVAGACMRVAVLACRTANKAGATITREQLREHLDQHWVETSELSVAEALAKGPRLVT